MRKNLICLSVLLLAYHQYAPPGVGKSEQEIQFRLPMQPRVP